MNELAIMTITKALDNCVGLPRLNWSRKAKAEVTFTKWTLEELLLLVWDHPWTLASETIEKFAEKLEVFEEMAVSEDQQMIFAIAAETAWAILKEIKPFEF